MMVYCEVTGESTSALEAGMESFRRVLRYRAVHKPVFAAVCCQKAVEDWTDRRVVEYWASYYRDRGFGIISMYTWQEDVASWDIPGVRWVLGTFLDKYDPNRDKHFLHYQFWVQTHCLHLHKAWGTKWVLQVDLDEFIRPLSSIQALLAGREPRHSYTFASFLPPGFRTTNVKTKLNDEYFENILRLGNMSAPKASIQWDNHAW
jgi:hypothetical protein